MSVAGAATTFQASRGTPAQRARARAVAAVSWLASRLPERPLYLLADLAGSIAYHAQPKLAAQARRNLGRVVDWLAASGMGSAAAREAARDRGALEALVRSAFRHRARYYLELMRTPAMTRDFVAERLTVETPDVVDEAFRSDRPAILIGMHLGAIELPALYLALRAGRTVVAPMETVGDPALQRWFERTRSSVGLRIVGLREARRELLGSLRAGLPVPIVGDRDLTGGGTQVTLFGAPAPLPFGPALLALESGAPHYVATVRRDGDGRYLGRAEALPAPPGGSRRERATAILNAEARAFERMVALAPDQWWAIFFPIWPDLEARA